MRNSHSWPAGLAATFDFFHQEAKTCRMSPDLLYQLALTQVPNIGPVQARILAQHFESAASIFRSPIDFLEKIEGIGVIRARSIKSFSSFREAEKEIAFIQKYQIQPLFIKDLRFPQRLLNCHDTPVLLFYKGKADLNASRIVSIVGTRSNTEYGKHFAENLVKELAALDVMIVSGLAFGIDAIAHKSAIKCNLPTVGVVGHGLDQLYPPQHQGLAREMVKEGGGLLTEFRSGMGPEKHHFPGRNRIVAGISDATIVIETGQKGGSLITAELANSYNRDVFAVPGRTIDGKSAGCNQLIRTNKAALLTDARELVALLGWEDRPKPALKPQKQLLLHLSKEEAAIVGMLAEKEMVHLDELNIKTGISASAIAAALLNLEIQNAIQALPGKRYRLM